MEDAFGGIRRSPKPSGAVMYPAADLPTVDPLISPKQVSRVVF
jgi:hypothetical protein